MFKSIAIAVLFVATQAHAIYDPSWDRPIQSAQMKVTKAVGSLADVQSVVLTQTRRDGTHGVGFNLELDGKTTAFAVDTVTQDGCGSTIYNVSPVILPGRMSVPFVTELSILDHSTRRCRDFRPYRWEAERVVRDVREGQVLSEIEFVGNPEHVFTITSVNE